MRHHQGNRSWPAPSLRDAGNRTFPFVTAMIKGDSASAATPLGHWAIKGGDATASDGLRTLFNGPRPCAGKPPACVNKGNQSWSPMRKFGGIIVMAPERVAGGMPRANGVVARSATPWLVKMPT